MIVFLDIFDDIEKDERGLISLGAFNKILRDVLGDAI